MLKCVKSGFTLIELLLVLAILSVLAAIQMPRLNALSAKSALHSEASTLRMSMLTARTKAVMERREVRLCFDPPSMMYWFEEQSDPINAPDEFLKPSTGPLGRAFCHKSTFVRTADQPDRHIRFLPSGQIDSGDIELIDTKGNYARLQINKATNRININYGKTD